MECDGTGTWALLKEGTPGGGVKEVIAKQETSGLLALTGSRGCVSVCGVCVCVSVGVGGLWTQLCNGSPPVKGTGLSSGSFRL